MLTVQGSQRMPCTGIRLSIQGLLLPITLSAIIHRHLHSYSERQLQVQPPFICCSKIAEAEAAVSVNKKKWLVMHMHVQLQLDELRGPPFASFSGRCAQSHNTTNERYAAVALLQLPFPQTVRHNTDNWPNA
jgi:hypothetical protein